MIPATGCVKNYHWGKVGESSFIARFQAAKPETNGRSSNGHKSDGHKQHLAELWFGSHPSGPAVLTIGDRKAKLNEFLSVQPEMVGRVDSYFKYNKQLPYLFKILSIAQPLSLQAHPDKKLAQVLHKKDPKNYPDANHKPELAIALTEFHVLCDFRPHLEISKFIRELTPLREALGESVCAYYLTSLTQNDKALRANALGECFKSLMTREKDVISKGTAKLLTSPNLNVVGPGLTTVVAHLQSLYPGDPGVLAPFFLNCFKLEPGQSIYLEANKLHAYLSGDCIECMACSDNVVRAGLTSKFRDVQTLTSMLNYEAVNSAEDLILKPTRKSHYGCTVELFAPTNEFKVEKTVISGRHEYTIPSVGSGSFVIVLNGKTTSTDFFHTETKHHLGPGSAAFIPPDISVKLSDIRGELVVYRAFC